MADSNSLSTQPHTEKPESTDILIASPDANWYFGRQSQVAFDTGEHQHNVHVVTMVTSQTAIEQFVNGKLIKHSARSNNTFVLPLEALHRFTWQQNIEFIYAGLSTEILQQVGREMLKGDRVELRPQLEPQQDPLIQGVLYALNQAFQSGDQVDSATHLFVQQLQLTLAMHIWRQYGIVPPKISSNQQGLSPTQLKRVLAYIDANLAGTLGLEELAQQAGMSQFHFCRLFQRSMHVSPYRYVIQQKVNRAKHLLRATSLSINEIATILGFSHQNQLTSHFRKVLGMTPSAYRKQ